MKRGLYKSNKKIYLNKKPLQKYRWPLQSVLMRLEWRIWMKKKKEKKKEEVALWRLQGTHKVTVYVRSGRKQIQPPVIQTEAGNHPLLCTQGVKVTFHNTSEIGLMEELVHGFCWIGNKKPWKKAVTRDWSM